jgi:SAM-dependent MidA family methyltransferase
LLLLAREFYAHARHFSFPKKNNGDFLTASRLSVDKGEHLAKKCCGEGNKKYPADVGIFYV